MPARASMQANSASLPIARESSNSPAPISEPAYTPRPFARRRKPSVRFRTKPSQPVTEQSKRTSCEPPVNQRFGKKSQTSFSHPFLLSRLAGAQHSLSDARLHKTSCSSFALATQQSYAPALHSGPSPPTACRALRAWKESFVGPGRSPLPAHRSICHANFEKFQILVILGCCNRKDIKYKCTQTELACT